MESEEALKEVQELEFQTLPVILAEGKQTFNS